jgi:hypothetical protein
VGAQFPASGVPLPPPPIVAAPAPLGNPPIDVNAPYLEPFELPPSEPIVIDEGMPLALPAASGPRFWMSADYLFWWIKRAPQSTPLVVTGSPTDAFPGAADQPNTRVLYGGNGLGFNPFSGARMSLGLWCGPDDRLGFELAGFILGQKANQYEAGGNATGQPFIARPFVNALTGADNVYFVSQNFADPLRTANMTGGIIVSSNSSLWGWEINSLYNLSRSDTTAVNAIAGFSSVGLREKLHISETLENLGPTGGVTYLGAVVPPTQQELTFDKFDTQNVFYGGQLGARTHFQQGAWGLDLTGTVGIGEIQQLVAIEGMTVLEGPNGKLLAETPGGVYAVSSNSGRHFRTVFGVVPEGAVNLTYSLTQNVVLKFGYTFVYMNDVARPGAQVNTHINPGLVPSDATFGTPGGPLQPGFQWHTSDFWAQGANVGVEIRY